MGCKINGVTVLDLRGPDGHTAVGLTLFDDATPHLLSGVNSAIVARNSAGKVRLADGRRVRCARRRSWRRWRDGADAWCLEIERPDLAVGQNRRTGRKRRAAWKRWLCPNALPATAAGPAPTFAAPGGLNCGRRGIRPCRSWRSRRRRGRPRPPSRHSHRRRPPAPSPANRPAARCRASALPPA